MAQSRVTWDWKIGNVEWNSTIKKLIEFTTVGISMEEQSRRDCSRENESPRTESREMKGDTRGKKK